MRGTQTLSYNPSEPNPVPKRLQIYLFIFRGIIWRNLFLLFLKKSYQQPQKRSFTASLCIEKRSYAYKKIISAPNRDTNDKIYKFISLIPLLYMFMSRHYLFTNITPLIIVLTSIIGRVHYFIYIIFTVRRRGF